MVTTKICDDKVYSSVVQLTVLNDNNHNLDNNVITIVNSIDIVTETCINKASAILTKVNIDFIISDVDIFVMKVDQLQMQQPSTNCINTLAAFIIPICFT